MSKPSNFPEKQTWGTWEELLLACAVHRYGTDSWDSVATEVQKRSSSIKTLTGHSCKLKYHDLKRRFSKTDAVSKTETDKDNNVNIPPWLEELKKLRVAELRREVERCDLSIVSLQLKVKRLREEREQSLREDVREIENSDLEKATVESDKKEEDVKVGLPETIAGEDSDREDRSVNESNSTDPKAESPETGQGEAHKEREPAEPVSDEPDQTVEKVKRGGEDSCNSVAEESDRVDSGGAGDSAESKGGVGDGEEGEGGKDTSSSNVQSSSSLSWKEKKVEEAQNQDNQSPAIKCSSVQSQPLVDILEMLRSHRLGSLFERRLETQETPNYTNLIRQHIDLETIRMRLEDGCYSGCSRKFFRDLLLLFNNALVFFGKKSSESLAAIELRQLVSKELACITPTPEPLPKEQPLVPQDPEPSESLAVKPKMRVLMIACRKRSSIQTKASPLFSRPEKKADEKANSVEEKLAVDLKQNDKPIDKPEEPRITKKRTRERFTLGSRNSDKNSRGRTGAKANKNSDASSNSGFSAKAGSQNENLESKLEKEKKNNTNASSKKKGAANFLDRMKRSSPSNNVSLLDSLKQPVNSSDNVKGTEHKKSSNIKADSKKDQNSKKGSGGKPARERRNSGKRNVGRPPKRAAAPPATTAVVPAKRVREAVGTEVGSSGHAKKRSRR